MVVNLVEAVNDCLLAFIKSAKCRTAGVWGHQFEEGLNGLDGQFFHTWGGTVIIVVMCRRT